MQPARTEAALRKWSAVAYENFKIVINLWANPLTFKLFCSRIIGQFGYRGVAQLVEQRSPKPRAQGSSPCTPANV